MDARVRETHDVVLGTGLRLLIAEGASAVTHARISAETGVARTTIYRHWPTRSSLLFAAFLRGRNPVETPDTGDVRADLIAHLQSIRDSLWESPIANVLVVVYHELETDPELDGLHRQIRDFVRADLTAMLDRAREQGLIDSPLSDEELLSVLLGPIFYERLLGHARASDALIEHVVHLLTHDRTTWT